MQLFLSSIFVSVADKFLDFLGKPPEGLKVAFVPTAADNYEDKWFVDADREKLKELGFTVKDVSLAGKTFEQLKSELAGMDMVFVGGGNSFYLLQETRKSGFDKLVSEMVQSGVVYVGSSAGSLLVCESVEPVSLFDEPAEAPGLQDYTGLGFLDKVILPHYGKPKYEEKYQETLNRYGKDYDLILLRDDQVVTVDERGVQVI